MSAASPLYDGEWAYRPAGGRRAGGLRPSSEGDLIQRRPMEFISYFRPQVWGSRALEDLLGRTIPVPGPIGEAWQLSGHPLHISRVGSGPAAGMPLDELWRNHAAELTGWPEVTGNGRFPILAKVLDCSQLLSVQVHPDTDFAREALGEPIGKSEVWVVLAVDPGAEMYVGFQPGVTEADLTQALAGGRVAELLQRIHPQVGDCFDLPAGTVHAVGGGLVLAEIQQCSDATYRLFDWNRLGLDGRPRQLHIEEALRAIKWNLRLQNPVSPQSVFDPHPGVVRELLVERHCFRVERLSLSSAAVPLATGTMQVMMVLAGEIELDSGEGAAEICPIGRTVLVPATAAREYEYRGTGQILSVTVPRTAVW